jgi:hypothetical protein
VGAPGQGNRPALYDKGRIWAKQFRHDFDHRPLAETGIRPGMRLEAIRPERRVFKQHS